MPRRLSIGSDERGKIAAAMAHARASIKPLAKVASAAVNTADNVMTYEQRQKAVAKAKLLGPLSRQQGVVIPDGYWCFITFEQQPPGLCKHLSVSLMDDDKHPIPKALPDPLALGYIAQAFEISEAAVVAKWVEEFEPGCYAINLVALDRSN